MALTHIDENGNACMVDISEKAVTKRTALARGNIRMTRACYDLVKSGGIKKGDVTGTARIAGIMGAKRTQELIPLCHNIPLSKVAVDFEFDDENCVIRAICTVSCEGKTGVEMEALTGVQIALLTIYDMCKAADRSMVMEDIRLVSKSGGKSGEYSWH
ncbi:MAG: cyclic pyranopterin monophosphate synthase MoaC [Lachnospiraceae bacterium]|nr:cyclic pyranopterin monophosphate synthase MoaC [Lachnospiraceae bacterium]